MNHTREQVIAMARDAAPGFQGGDEADGTMEDSIVGIDAVMRFAEIVAERAALAMQERCAKVCELEAANHKSNQAGSDHGGYDWMEQAAESCASEIRALPPFTDKE